MRILMKERPCLERRRQVVIESKITRQPCGVANTVYRTPEAAVEKPRNLYCVSKYDTLISISASSSNLIQSKIWHEPIIISSLSDVEGNLKWRASAPKNKLNCSQKTSNGSESRNCLKFLAIAPGGCSNLGGFK